MKTSTKWPSFKCVLLLILIIGLMISVRIFVGTQKEYFHMDEMYSYGLMNYDKVNIADNPDLMGQWHAPEYFKDYISISSDEVRDWSPVYKNQVNDVHPPLYYVLLRLAALTTVDGFSKWTGIGLNIVIFVFSAILIFAISRRLTKNDRLSLMITLFVGLTAAALNSTIYIRMYELASFNILLISYFALRLMNLKKFRGWHMLVLVLVLTIGALTHYHYLFYAGALSIVLLYQLFKEKRRDDAVKYILAAVVAAAICLIIFPAMLSHLLHGHPGDVNYFLDLPRVFWYLYIIDKGLFNHTGVILLSIGIAGIFLRRQQKRPEKNSSIPWILIIPTMVFFLIIAITSPWVELRYIMPICSIVAILAMIGLANFTKKYFGKIWIAITSGFMIISLLLTFVVQPRLEMTWWYNDIVTRVEQYNSPIIYVLNTDHNRFLDDFYLLTLNESYVMNNDDAYDIENWRTALADQDTSKGFILITNYDVKDDTVIEQIKSVSGLKNSKYLQRMNVANVYRLD
ncbi:hypothetical protein FWC31_01155 [Candidatus Saccharibacteria bacterium]|nr:hypothetical protein [Candidatus Saccharibacteria bacterium]